MSQDVYQNFLRKMRNEGVDMQDAAAIHNRLRKGQNDPNTRRALRTVLRRMSQSFAPS